MVKIAVLGCGSWGLTLARLLCRKGFDVAAWEFDPEVAEQLQTYIDAGVKYIVVRMLDFPRTDGIAMFAEEVMPLLRA